MADHDWGLDHGTWSILVHALPEPRIPVLQLSMDSTALPQSMQWAINSAEHYAPLVYMLGAAYEDEPLQLFNDVAVGGVLTMTSVRWGR